jgi:uncharacterized protein with NRDE domain
MNPDKNWKLILASNRDERYDRETNIMNYYPEEQIIGSRDGNFDGMQIGISLNGKIAAVTNLAGIPVNNNDKSRGLLVTEFLTKDDFIDYLDYRPYNLLTIMINKYAIGASVRRWCDIDISYINPNQVYGFGNNELDENCYRINKAKESLDYIIRTSRTKNKLIEGLFEMLNSTEKGMSDTSIFMEPKKDTLYGTRTQTIILIDKNNRITFIERNLLLNSLMRKELFDIFSFKGLSRRRSIITDYFNQWIETEFEFDLKR